MSYLITVGSLTTTGGTVISGSSCLKVNGMSVALIGDKASCNCGLPACKKIGEIKELAPRSASINKKSLALAGDMVDTGCGLCFLAPSPHQVMLGPMTSELKLENGVSMGNGVKINLSPATPATFQPSTHSSSVAVSSGNESKVDIQQNDVVNSKTVNQSNSSDPLKEENPSSSFVGVIKGDNLIDSKKEGSSLENNGDSGSASHPSAQSEKDDQLMIIYPTKRNLSQLVGKKIKMDHRLFYQNLFPVDPYVLKQFPIQLLFNKTTQEVTIKRAQFIEAQDAGVWIPYCETKAAVGHCPRQTDGWVASGPFSGCEFAMGYDYDERTVFAAHIAIQRGTSAPADFQYFLEHRKASVWYWQKISMPSLERFSCSYLFAIYKGKRIEEINVLHVNVDKIGGSDGEIIGVLNKKSSERTSIHQ